MCSFTPPCALSTCRPSMNEGLNRLKFFSPVPIKRSSVRTRQRCDLTRPNAALSPWRQVRRPLRPDEHPCRQGTLLYLPIPPKITPPLQNLLQWVFGDPKRRHAHRHSISGHFDHCRVACPRRALGFPARFRGGLRVSSGGLHVPRPPPRYPGTSPFAAWLMVASADWDLHDSYLSSVLSTLIYVPTEHHWSNPLRALEFWPRHLRFKPVAIPCADS